MTYTFNEAGKCLTETQEGCTMPADYSFETVNDFVHGVGVSFEDLQGLCLGMACEIDNMNKRIKDAPIAVLSMRSLLDIDIDAANISEVISLTGKRIRLVAEE